MSYFYAFLGRYKRILIEKIRNKEDFDKSIILKEVAKATIFMLIIFIAIGYFIRTLEDLNYVFYIVNTTILGSFLIYRYIEEINYKLQCDYEYSVLDAIIIDLITLVSVLSIANALLFTIYFQDSISIIEYIIVLVISLICQLILYKADNVLGKYVGQKRLTRRVLVSSVWIFLLIVVLMVLLPIESLPYSYLTSFSIVSVLYVLKINLFYPRDKFGNYDDYFQKAIGFLIVFIIAVIILSPIDEDEYGSIRNSLTIEKIPNYNKTILVCDGEDIRSIYSNSDYIFIKTDNHLYIYDHDFIEIKVIEKQFLGELYVFDDILYYLESNEMITYNTENKSLYELSENNEFQMVLTADLYVDTELFRLDNEAYFYNFQRSMDLSTFDLSGNLESLNPNQREILSTTNHIMINEDSVYTMYSNDNEYNDIFYSNNYFIKEEADRVYLSSAEAYLRDGISSLNSETAIELSDYSGTKIKNFIVKNDKIYIKSRAGVLNIYNLDNYNKIEEVYLANLRYYLSYYKDFVYEGSTVYSFGNVYTETIIPRQSDALVLSLGVLIIASFLYVEPRNLIFGERGKKYDWANYCSTYHSGFTIWISEEQEYWEVWQYYYCSQCYVISFFNYIFMFLYVS